MAPSSGKNSNSPMNEASLEKKLTSLVNTQDSIQTLSLWCLHHKQHYQKIVVLWMKVLKKAKIPHRLCLYYLANDILQHSKRKGWTEFSVAWSGVLKETTPLVRDEKIRRQIERIFTIWEDRGVFKSDFTDELKAILEDVQVCAVANAKLLAEFKPANLIQKITRIGVVTSETRGKLTQLQANKVDVCSSESLAKLKDRGHGSQFTQDFDESTDNLDAYVKALEVDVQERAIVIEALEQGEIFYDAQKGEAKIVANAYKNFGNRVKNLKRRLDELGTKFPAMTLPPEEPPSPTESNGGLSPLAAGPKTHSPLLPPEKVYPSACISTAIAAAVEATKRRGSFSVASIQEANQEASDMDLSDEDMHKSDSYMSGNALNSTAPLEDSTNSADNDLFNPMKMSNSSFLSSTSPISQMPSFTNSAPMPEPPPTESLTLDSRLSQMLKSMQGGVLPKASSPVIQPPLPPSTTADFSWLNDIPKPKDQPPQEIEDIGSSTPLQDEISVPPKTIPLSPVKESNPFGLSLSCSVFPPFPPPPNDLSPFVINGGGYNSCPPPPMLPDLSLPPPHMWGFGAPVIAPPPPPPPPLPPTSQGYSAPQYAFDQNNFGGNQCFSDNGNMYNRNHEYGYEGSSESSANSSIAGGQGTNGPMQSPGTSQNRDIQSRLQRLSKSRRESSNSNSNLKTLTMDDATSNAPQSCPSSDMDFSEFDEFESDLKNLLSKSSVVQTLVHVATTEDTLIDSNNDPMFGGGLGDFDGNMRPRFMARGGFNMRGGGQRMGFSPGREMEFGMNQRGPGQWGSRFRMPFRGGPPNTGGMRRPFNR